MAGYALLRGAGVLCRAALLRRADRGHSDASLRRVGVSCLVASLRRAGKRCRAISLRRANRGHFVASLRRVGRSCLLAMPRRAGERCRAVSLRRIDREHRLVPPRRAGTWHRRTLLRKASAPVCLTASRAMGDVRRLAVGGTGRTASSTAAGVAPGPFPTDGLPVSVPAVPVVQCRSRTPTERQWA